MELISAVHVPGDPKKRSEQATEKFRLCALPVSEKYPEVGDT